MEAAPKPEFLPFPRLAKKDRVAPSFQKPNGKRLKFSLQRRICTMPACASPASSTERKPTLAVRGTHAATATSAPSRRPRRAEGCSVALCNRFVLGALLLAVFVFSCHLELPVVQRVPPFFSVHVWWIPA